MDKCLQREVYSTRWRFNIARQAWSFPAHSHRPRKGGQAFRVRCPPLLGGGGWGRFAEEVPNCLVAFFDTRSETTLIDTYQKQGVITCIPKDKKPKQFINYWRPISLLNTAYKIAASHISNRSKAVLPNIIHQDHKGFMKVRYIGEHIILLYVLLYTERENVPGLLQTIDVEKAFDSVSWSFIQKALGFFKLRSRY